jgi:fructose-1,6-bisphosphatase
MSEGGIMNEFGINMTQVEAEKPVKEKKKSEEPVKAESKLP